MNIRTRLGRLLSVVCLVGVGLAGVGAWSLGRQAEAPVLPERVVGAGVEVGVNVALEQYDAVRLAAVLADLRGAGVRRVRQTFRWAELEPEPGVYDWRVSDRIVAATDAQGMLVLAALETSPAWARDVVTPTAPPRDPALFGAFARAFAERYGARVAAYQVWDEPNITLGWGGPPVVEEYAALLQAGYTALHAADSGAIVVAAGLAPTVEQGPANLSDVLYLERLYQVGAGPYFDAAAGKPYGFDGAADAPADAAVLNAGRLELLRAVMVRYGDSGKALWASHLGWNALPADWRGPPSLWGAVSEVEQAEYSGALITRARLTWPWAGPLFFTQYQAPVGPDDPFSGFNWVTAAGAPRPVVGAVRAALAEQAAWPGWYAAEPGPFATFTGGWRFSELGADSSETLDGQAPDRLDFVFYGTDVGLTVRRGDYRAHFVIAVDDRPANALPQDEAGAYLTLTAPDRKLQVSTVPVARDLAPGRHVLTVRAVRGWGQWALVGVSVADAAGRPAAAQAAAWAWVLVAACVLGVVVAGAQAEWGAAWRGMRARYLAWTTAWQWVATWLAAGAFYATAWLAWGERVVDVGRPFYLRLGEGGQVALLAAVTAAFYYAPAVPVALAALVLLAVLVYWRLELGVAVAAFWMPFYVLPKRFGESGIEMTSLMIWLCVGVWLVQAGLAWRRGDGRPMRWQWLDGAVVAFVLAGTLALPGAAFAREAAREYRTVIIEPALLYALVRVLRLERAGLWRVVNAFILGGVVIAGVGLVQYVAGINIITAEGGAPRLGSVYRSPNNVGLYLGRVLPVLAAALVLWRGMGRVRRWVYAGAFVLVALALVLSFSRGALLLGVPAGLGVVLWAWDRRRGGAILLLTAVVGVTGLGIAAWLSPALAARLNLAGDTGLVRLTLWRSTVALIADHPWFGVGPDNFLYAYRGYYIQPEAWREPDLSHPHNLALDYAARLGLVGLAAGVALQVGFWRTLRAAARRAWGDPASMALVVGLMGSMADTLAHGLVDNGYFLVDLACVFMLTLGVGAALVDAAEEPLTTAPTADPP